jgi:hypothetical protein
MTALAQISYQTLDGVRVRYADSGGAWATLGGDRFVESMRYVRHDRVVPVANLDARLPNGRVALIDAGHFVWEEAPAEYAAIILQALP